IATRIIESDRNRPAALRDQGAPTPEMLQRRQASIEHWARDGMPPDEVADIVLAAIREERFYILTHPDYKTRVEERMQAILQDGPPPPLPAPLPPGAGGGPPAAGAGGR